MCARTCSLWNKEGRMSELIATLVTKGSYFQRMPRINLNAVEDLPLRNKAKDCPRCFYSWSSSSVCTFRQSKQMLPGKCGLCCRSGAQLVCTRTDDQGDHSLWVLTGLARSDVQAGSVSTQTLFLRIQRWSVCWRLNFGNTASTVSEGGKYSQNTFISRSLYTGEIGACWHTVSMSKQVQRLVIKTFEQLLRTPVWVKIFRDPCLFRICIRLSLI